ncbi:hypothetical protein [Sorangium sp. So ce131]|uniref:hypothetical protein n=1 Tax=Sorangium sp. So ce131 TaxID=3133282 RepID=UPI003F5DA9B3
MRDADISLRHITRRRPEDLARTFVPEGRSVEAIGWIDTQLTALERRLDKALRLRVGGEQRVLHVEFCFSLRDDVPDRIFEYLGFLFTALRRESPRERVPPIESVVVVLTGGRRRLPPTGARRTAWPERRFSGVHFKIDAVYQRTVAELRARGSLLWLVFAPLARDATAAKMRDVAAEIRAGAANYEEQVDLFTAFLVMATVDPWRHNLLEEIRMLTREMETELILRLPGIKELVQKVAQERAQQLAQERVQQLAQERAQQLAQERAQQLAQERAQQLAQERAQQLAQERAQQLAQERAQQLAQERAQQLAQERAQQLAREAEQRGELRGVQKGEQQGKEQAIAELLGRLFARRVGRTPTRKEERAIVERAKAVGPGEVEDALLDLEGDALVRWLSEPVSR